MQKIYKIYTLQNPLDNKGIRYVGITTKSSINERFSQHKYSALNNKRRITPVSKWIYSLLSIGISPKIELIEECFEENWELYEQYWISQFKTWGFNLLNLDEGGKGVITKNKRSVSGIERSIKAHQKPIFQLDDNKNIINKFNSIKEACQFHKLKSLSSITNVLSAKEGRKCVGSYWCYENDYDKFIIKAPSTAADRVGIKIYQYSKDLKLVKIFNTIDSVLVTFLKSRSSNPGGLKSAIKNNTIWKNYLWSYNKV